MHAATAAINAGRLRLKESDRLKSTARLLRDLGGSVEELELALVYLPIYCMLKSYFKSGDCIPSPRGIFILGASAACLLWSKFTLLGIYIGYVVFTAVLLIKRRSWKRLGCAAGMFVCGAAAASLPWIIYFAVNNALGDMFTVYFYNNLFLYAEEKSLFKYLFYLGGAFYQNMLFLVIAIVGAVAVIRSKYAPAFKWGMFSLYFCNVFFIYVGGIAFEYYAYGMAALSVFGFIALAEKAEKLITIILVNSDHTAADMRILYDSEENVIKDTDAIYHKQ